VFCPVRIGWLDTKGPGELKAEAAVIPGIAKEHDGRLVKGVGSRKHGVRQGLPDAATLEARQHAQWPQPNAGTSVYVGAATHDVSDHALVDQSDQREGRDNIAVAPKCVNEVRLGTSPPSGRANAAVWTAKMAAWSVGTSRRRITNIVSLLRWCAPSGCPLVAICAARTLRWVVNKGTCWAGVSHLTDDVTSEVGA
jgi:hypothetical protein